MDVYETHNEKAEKMNGRFAMIGIVAAFGAYAMTGQIIPGYLVMAPKKKPATKTRLDKSCWKGYKKQGTKVKGGTRVNNCVKKSKPLFYLS